MGLIHSRASKKRDKAQAELLREQTRQARGNRQQQRTEAAGDNPWRQPTLGGAISAARRNRAASRQDAGPGQCDLCGGPLTERWQCGRGSTSTTYHNGGATGTTVGIDGGGPGGSWTPAEPGETHVFCSQAHQQQWMRQNGWAAQDGGNGGATGLPAS